MTTVETSIGTADVLHRLALGVEAVDAIRRRVVSLPLRVGREVPARLGTAPVDASWPCLDLEPHGPGRYALRGPPPQPAPLQIRITDPSRRFAPRRLQVPAWTLAEVEDADRRLPVGVLVPARSRLLRPWLLPGVAYDLPRGATGIRGRVTRAAGPLRWARITAVGPGAMAVGWAHADERGEFLLVVTGTGAMPPPAPSDFPVTLVVSAPTPPPGPAADDAFADLAVELLPRSAAPPLPADLDNDVLRGLALPAGYAASASPPTPVTVEVGTVTTLSAAIDVTP